MSEPLENPGEEYSGLRSEHRKSPRKVNRGMCEEQRQVMQLDRMSRTTKGKSHIAVLQAMVWTLNCILRGIDSHGRNI